MPLRPSDRDPFEDAALDDEALLGGPIERAPDTGQLEPSRAAWPALDDELAAPDATIIAIPAPNGAKASIIAEAAAQFGFGDPIAALDHTDVKPTLLDRDDGQALLYPASVNLLAGEPSSGKSWVAQAVVRDLVNAGDRVLYLDYEDVLAKVAGRLVALGTRRDALHQLDYPLSIAKLGPQKVAALAEYVRAVDCPLIIIDGVAEALSAHGLREDVAGDYAAWHDTVPRSLARLTHATVLLIDHVPKPGGNREHGADLYPRGSGHKLAAIDGAAYMVTAIVPFSRSNSGVVTLTIAKDRHGHVGPRRARAAYIRVIPHDNGATVTLLIEQPIALEDEPSSSGSVTITAELKDGIVDVVGTLTRRGKGNPASKSEIQNRLRGTKKSIKFANSALGPALEQLIDERRIELAPRTGRGTSEGYRLPPLQIAMDVDPTS
jgi:hypothetical protein